LAFFIGYIKRPKLDVQVTENPVYYNNKLLKKEFYFHVTNTGKSTARKCQVKVIQRPFPNPPPLKRGEITEVMYERFTVAYLDWFEPTGSDYGTSSDLRTKLGKFVNLFPDPTRPLFAGRIEVFDSSAITGQVGTFANIVTEDKLTDKSRQVKESHSARGLSMGTSHELEVVFSWEREHLESYSQRYILNHKSIEEASMILTID
jgi:hypothetical protein